MGKKLSSILGVGLVAAVLASLFVAATPASAGTLAWSGESTRPTRTGADVFDIAAASNGTTIYAAGGTTDLIADPVPAPAIAIRNNLAKSTNGGTSWAAVGLPSIGTGLPALINGVVEVDKVVVAPDSADGSFVAALVSDNSVAGAPVDGVCAIYVSTDGGANFSGPLVPAAGALIDDIAVSPAVNGVRSIAAAGTLGGMAKLWIFTPASGFGTGTGWVDTTGGTANVTFMDTTQTTAFAVAFSPNYLGDKVIAVVTANAGGNPRLQLFTTAVSTWNSPVYTGWDTNKGVTVSATANATGAELALAPTFNANDPTTRYAYVAVNATGAGLFRVVDTTASNSLIAFGVADVALSTAGDNLVAGLAGSNAVYRMATPSAATSVAVATVTYKAPGFATNTMTQVAYAGTNVVAGTRGSESAFSLSTDAGKDFSDISLVDSSATLKDFTVAADGSKIYLVASTASAVSVWKKTTAYTRIFCQANTLATPDYVVDIAPENSDVVYVAERGGTRVWYSNDGGATTWTVMVANTPIADFHVESATIAWAGDANGVVSKSSGYFFTNVTTLPFGVNMMSVLGANAVLVGGAGGQVAYTTDGAAFTTLTTGGTGAIVATADKLSSGGNIYAVSADGKISRYAIGTSTAFAQIHSTVTGFQGFGIALGGTTLYVTADNTSQTNVYRTLSPTTATVVNNVVDIGWNVPVTNITAAPQDSITLGVQQFRDTPRGLVVTVGSDKNPKLWALATGLESMVDTLTAAGPTLSGPANGATIAINAQTGQAMDVAYQWGAVAGATKYSFQVALDSAFTQILATQSPTSNLMLFGPNVAGADGVTKIAYQPDTTYYWRVKVAADGPMDSPQSATGNFKIGTLTPLKIVAPEPGATDVPIKPDFSWTTVTGATNYEIFVSDDPTFAVITFSANSDKAVYASTESLAYSTTYYWRVRASAPAGSVTPFVYGIFTTGAKPTTATPPITVTQQGPTTITVSVPPPVNLVPNYLLWIIIGIGAILVIALIVLIARTRRTS